MFLGRGLSKMVGYRLRNIIKHQN